MGQPNSLLKKEGFFSNFKYKKKENDSLFGTVYIFFSKRVLKPAMMKVLT
jgi:hypothetical protein